MSLKDTRAQSASVVASRFAGGIDGPAGKEKGHVCLKNLDETSSRYSTEINAREEVTPDEQCGELSTKITESGRQELSREPIETP